MPKTFDNIGVPAEKSTDKHLSPKPEYQIMIQVGHPLKIIQHKILNLSSLNYNLKKKTSIGSGYTHTVTPI